MKLDMSEAADPIGQDMLGLAADEVHLWMADCARVDPGLRGAYASYLPPEEIARMARFHFETDRLRYLLTRALVRTTLSRYCLIAPGAWWFVTNAYGCPRVSPEIQGAEDLVFNLSHTSTCVVLAVTRSRAVGVDVEEGGRRAPLDVADHHFAPPETRALQALPPEHRPHRFFEVWTLKESYIKARTMGLSIPLDHFHFDFSTDGHVALHTEPALQDLASNWDFWQFRPHGHRLVALCTGTQPAPVRRVVWREVLPGRDERVLDVAVVRRSLQVHTQADNRLRPGNRTIE